jgi:Icc-related predicted phosphoesterase
VKDKLRLAAVGDVHYTRTSQGAFARIFGDVSQRADVLVLCGDLTDYGHVDEATVLARDLAHVKIPVLAVLGNHDCESGHEAEVTNILREAGVVVLDGEAIEVQGVGFCGAKGFAGGFDRRTLEPWGEVAIKNFVREAADEALKLERALARLHTPQRVAILHYAPIRGTVVGEDLEIYPFLGSSRLEDPINRHKASLVIHGHAHHGAPEGRTSTGIPVYNCAMPLLKRTWPDRPPVRILELDVQPERHDDAVDELPDGARA